MAQQSQGELLQQQQSQPEDEDGAGEQAMGSRVAKPLVRELNRQIVCPLCRGYLIDATTLVECMHTFCRACIIYRLKNGPKTCPACDTIVFARPRADFVLQRLIYLVVPGLFKSELERRRVFRASQPVPLGAPELSFDDLVSLSLRELDAAPGTSSVTTRYLKCPAGVTVRHLTRLLMLKRGWDDVDGRSRQSGNSKIEMMHEVSMPGAKDGETEFEILDPAWTLMDLSCIFQWKREAPMRLYYRIIRVDEVATDQQAGNSSSTSINDASGNGSVNGNADASSQAMENIQRPPTPPPSPKPALSRGPEPSLDKSPKLPESPGPTPTEHYPREPSARKKPRCEVTPVIRAPDPLPPPEARPSKSSKPAKPEHHQHKRKKRRNKRVIAEITTTPREDLLKLKFRLTPCPPRVVSSTAASQTNDKIVQIRTVRKEKQPKSSDETKHRTPSDQPAPPPPPQPPQQQVSAESNEGEKSRSAESKEESAPSPKAPAPEKPKTESSVEGKSSAVEVTLAPSASQASKATERESSPKNEEVLRRLGLVAVSEANRSRQERTRSPSQSGPKQADPALEREKLEKRLRESKANRVRSLLAEKQMRDTLKSIMSSSKESPPASKPPQPSSAPKPEAAGRSGTPTGPKRKEPPPLTPLRSAKRPSVTFAPNAFTIGSGPSSKCDSPLDLSSPSSNALDLSAEAPVKPRPEDKPVTGILRSSGGPKGEKPREEPKKTQDTNLRTLSDAAVSLLGGAAAKPDKKSPPAQSPAAQQALPSPAASNKVALRIPQPHQRITGFGMKIKPNIGVRHIPNPQAVVVSQYRNQRTGYFGLAHQPP